MGGQSGRPASGGGRPRLRKGWSLQRWASHGVQSPAGVEWGRVPALPPRSCVTRTISPHPPDSALASGAKRRGRHCPQKATWQREDFHPDKWPVLLSLECLLLSPQRAPCWGWGRCSRLTLKLAAPQAVGSPFPRPSPANTTSQAPAMAL